MRHLLFIAMLLAAVACTPADPPPTAQPTIHPTTQPTVQPTARPTLQPSIPPSPEPTPTAVPKPDIGIQGQFIDPRYGDASIALAAELGVGWIKQQVDWNTVESAPGEYDWSKLDYFVDQAEARGLKILLGVARAPGFSRSEPVIEDGPPDDFTLFNRFMLALASRYRGRVAAYELWNEPNLLREWRGHDLNAATFVAFLRQGATGARRGDPDAVLISAAPGVTGINDGVNAIDDRVYLQTMLAAGAAQWVDAIGVHPYGAANPPDERAADATHHAGGFNNHPSFFFLDTLEDYHALLSAAGVDKPLWVTEFGWPSIDTFGDVETAGWEYAREVSEADQANYLRRAIALRGERPWLGSMFVWNLNVAWLLGGDNSQSAYSLIRPDGSLRPAYDKLRQTGE